MSITGNKSYSELQAIKTDIETVFANNKGQLDALSDSQLGVVAEQYGIPINPSDRLETLKILQSNDAISAWRLPFSKDEIAATVASNIDNVKEELQQQAREKIASASSTIVESVEQKASDNPMVEMITKNFQDFQLCDTLDVPGSLGYPHTLYYSMHQMWGYKFYEFLPTSQYPLLYDTLVVLVTEGSTKEILRGY